MSFIKDRVIYQSESSTVYINECHSKGKKTRTFAVRKNDDTGLAHCLGLIKFSGAWRQYVFEPDQETMWSAGCLEEIAKFLKEVNAKWRKTWQKKK